MTFLNDHLSKVLIWITDSFFGWRCDLAQQMQTLFKHGVLQRVGSGDIITIFDKTPTPRKNSDIYCPHFYELKWATGCPYNCDWCYLKGTFRFRAFPRNDRRVVPVFKDRSKIERAVKTFIKTAKTPAVLNTGELCDSLMGENQRPPFSEFILDLFKDTPHRVLFLTKGWQISHFLEHGWQENAILSWSINSRQVAHDFEIGAPDPVQRIEAARKVFEQGYEVRFRLDPMVPVEGWQQQYESIIKEMLRGIDPTVITLGTLRGLPATLAVANRKEWAQYLTEKSNWGRKPALETRMSMYSFAIERIHYHSLRIQRKSRPLIAICKDTREIWALLKEKFGIDYHDMRCNCL